MGVPGAQLLRCHGSSHTVVSFGGEIYGFADKANPLKCVYYNGTRVQNEDGSYNFNNVVVDSRVVDVAHACM